MEEEEHIHTPDYSKGDYKKRITRSVRNFVYQLAIVVIGIMLTFAGSDMIGNISQKKQLKQSMCMIVAELEKNQEIVVDIRDVMSENQRIFGTVAKYADDFSVISDTLERYANLLGTYYNFSFQKNAAEVLKISGMMHQESSQELLLQLFGCYDHLQKLQDEITSYYDNKNRKTMELLENLSTTELKSYFLDDSYHGIWQLYVKDTSTLLFLLQHLGESYSQSILNYCNQTETEVLATIDMIRKKYKI